MLKKLKIIQFIDRVEKFKNYKKIFIFEEFFRIIRLRQDLCNSYKKRNSVFVILPVDRSPNCSGITSRNNVIPITENTNIMITNSKTIFVMSKKKIEKDIF